MLSTTSEDPVKYIADCTPNLPKELSVEYLRRRVAEQSASPNGDFVVDFSPVECVDSVCIHELIRLHLTLRDQGRELQIVNVQPPVAVFLRLLRLDRSLNFSEICIETGQPCQPSAQRVDQGRGVVNYLLESFSRGRNRRRTLLRTPES